MSAKIIPVSNQPLRLREAMRPLSRREAVRRVIAAARANGLGAGAVTEQIIAIVAEFDLFAEYVS